MPDLLLELRSEEIPARMQARAAEDLRRLVTDALVERGLLYEGARAFSTPRRLTLHVAGLPAKGQDRREEKKGPRVGAPEAAVQGFLRSAGLASVEQATVETDPKKGSFYTAVSVVPGRATLDVLAEVLPKVVAEFPWPKSMRWGAASAEPGSPRWVRPLQSIVATLDTDTEEPQVIPFEAAGVRAGQTTFGHRFLAPAPIAVRRLDDYEASLRAAKVRLDREDRKNVIRADAANLAFAQGLEVVEDEALLEEVAGLVEWPVVMMGSFDERFLDVPAEAIRATIRANQKCFVLRDPATGRLANRFLLTANTIAADGGATIVAGNERVIRARLSDAKFFWDQDRKVRLEDRLPKLRQVTFHARLGSQWERVGRVVFFVRSVAAAVDPEKGGDLGPLADLAARGAVLAKADLTTEMVGEFPELQGLMGRYYATLEGEDARVCAVIEDHYKPLGPSDRVPTDLVGAAVALADKLDMLVCFWAIGETPSGSKDPYALRRAALGVIRIVLEKELSVPLRPLLRRHAFNLLNTVLAAEPTPDELAMTERANEILASGGAVEIPVHFVRSAAEKDKKADVIALAVVAFLHERLKVQLREQGARHDLVDAVLAANAPSLALPHEGGGNARDADLPSPPSSGRAGEGAAAAADDLLLVARRVAALGRFLATEDGATLLAGYRRAANILRAEEKKDGEGAFAGAPDPTSFIEPAERALHEAIIGARAETEAALARDDDEAAMGALARLRAPVDAFFEAVMVNAPDPEQRLNRLRLLDGLRSATRSVADFGRIAG